MEEVTAAHALLVDNLCQRGVLTNPRVEAAMRTVPRHVFVPNVPWEDAYRDQSVVTKRDSDGRPVSSASQPTIVTTMLEQLDVAPGQRVLEIGAGSGYNAALLSCLVADAGEVTTIDIDPEITEQAQDNLQAAGFPQVRVVCGDGGAGFAERAPYDRIIVTAGAWDLPPAWSAQLAPAGRLVVPLSIRGAQMAVAFELDDGIWHSVSVVDCGFIPMRGPLGDPNQTVQIGPGIRLHLYDPGRVDGRMLQAHLGEKATTYDVEVSATTREVVTTLKLWLAVTDPSYCRLSATVGADTTKVTPAVQFPDGEAFAPATIEPPSLAYLAPRDASSPASIQGGAPIQLEARGHGPNGALLAERLAVKIREWDRHNRPPTARLNIDAYPSNAPHQPATGTDTISQRNTTFAISWNE